MSLRVCSIDDLTPGEGLRIDAVSPPIAVFLTEDGEVYCLDDTCSHQDASLASGWVEDCRVECPLHESTFHLATGQVDQPPAKRSVRAHQAQVLDGEVYVELSTAEPVLPPGVRVP
ncbi:bifunctional 3-phenylpropionate/cinnamic acid dioxygenase ferredoxin subunit [Nesterenkonia ebinurensis]|uniref:bifunctional 3-phenylpropionate/cinnamic acid dioxygenase ferredoxin subunit n=1 Tax=Nesterenkonia ebinurensis TaxID=2608252 RepID=UPI00123D9B60|nr:bifunctional 3-phenylpropionate/cinnamic acid dioxygenase ferredoxin subunit [Nesterenkonia ebinurensis]